MKQAKISLNLYGEQMTRQEDKQIKALGCPECGSRDIVVKDKEVYCCWCDGTFVK
jgi:uncharacterized Zn finger protein (UPF0148 family)